MAKQGRPPKVSDEDIDALKAIVEANPTATMEEIRVELERRRIVVSSSRSRRTRAA